MATLPVHDPAFEAVGSIRTFGEHGPMYQVTGVAAPGKNGEARVSLLVIESGEMLDYSLEAVLNDPLKP
ncbi:MAG: DUF5397 family protein [Acidobacteriota bacterium]